MANLKKIAPIWNDKNNFSKIDVEIYKEIYSEVKQRSDDVLSQSEAITTKSIQILMLVTGLAAWFAANIIKHNFFNFYTFLLILIFIIEVWILMVLIFPRNMILRGTDARRILKAELDLIGDNVDGGEYSEEEKKKIFYYHQLNIYQSNIDLNRTRIKSRANIYKLSMILAFVLLVGTVIQIFSIIHP